MLEPFSRRRIAIAFLYDWVVAQASLLVAFSFYGNIQWLPGFIRYFLQTLQVRGAYVEQIDQSWQAMLPVFVLVGIIWPVCLFSFGVYDRRHSPTPRREWLNLTIACGVATMLLAGFLYFSYRDTARAVFLIFFVVDYLALTIARLSWWVYRRSHRSNLSQDRRPILIIGAGPVGKEVASLIQEYSWDSLRIIGFVDDDPAKQGITITDIPVLGPLEATIQIVAAQEIRDVVVALPLHAHAKMIEVCRKLQSAGVHVRVVPDLFSLSFPNASLSGFGGIPLIDLGLPGIYGWKRTIKRAFDLIFTFSILVFIWPIMLVVAVAIRLDSPGPIFFMQDRVGEHGRIFKVMKFRSMRLNSDASIHREHIARLIQENTSLDSSGGQSTTLKLTADPRITRVGHFIRKTSLDELPQFLNVLRGEMSLVGPRPPIPYEVDIYKEWHRRRLDAIPGITGFWQVHGRNRVSFDEMVRMDIGYIENQSIWLDIKLILLTPIAIYSGRGAG